MRILLISSVEHQSGSALRFRGLAGALARRGHDVHLLEPVPAGTVPETPAGVRRQPCPRLPGRPEGQALLWVAHGAAAVLRVKPDVCWALKALPNSWWPARLAGWRGSRVAVDLDDLDWGYYPDGWARRFLRGRFDSALRHADDVTVHTETMRARADAVRGGGRAAVFVDQGIDVARFAEARPVSGLRERLGLGPGPILLYAGHLGPASDLGPLLPALARVARVHPAGHLLVVGDGRERTRLEARAGQELPPGWARFVGTVVHAEVPAYFALADVALNFLEDTEANRHRASIKLREALAAGVPVVTSPTPDARRFAAWVEMPVGTGPDAFVDTLLATLARPERDRARAGQAWLTEHGTFDAAVRDLAVRWEEGS